MNRLFLETIDCVCAQLIGLNLKKIRLLSGAFQLADITATLQHSRLARPLGGKEKRLRIPLPLRLVRLLEKRRETRLTRLSDGDAEQEIE